MARHRRASMREGPLAQLFRSTLEEGGEDPAPDEQNFPGEETPPAASAPPEPPVEHRPTPSEEDVEHRPPLPEPAFETEPEIRIARPSEEPAFVPDEAAPARDARERLRSVFAETPSDRPRFGREDPAPPSTAPRIHTPILRVLGVGGAGVNAVNRMVEAGVTGVEFLAVNTDLQSLQQSSADITVHIGADLTRGLGAGADPDLGREAAMEGYDKIKALLKGSDMAFIAAGAGGGTGTGAAPVIARIAREVGALTVGIVTRPFGFEGRRRSVFADQGIEALRSEVDTLITIPNNRLLSILDRGTSMLDAFRVADDVLRQGVQGVSDLITLPGLINLDFADVRTTMSDAGHALLGIGMGVGENRAADAAGKAIASPLLETSVEGARSILLSITGGGDLSLLEVSEAAKVIQEAAHPDAEIIFGASLDDDLGDQCWITVIAARFENHVVHSPAPVREARPRREERRREASSRREAPSRRRAVPDGDDIDVPEFIPGRR